MNCDFSKASDWVKENVFPSLTNFDMKTFTPKIDPEQHGGYGEWYSPASLASVLSARMAGTGFIQMPDPAVEFWGYYSAYDHVALCQLFGTMMDLPKGFPMYCRDLKQWCDSLEGLVGRRIKLPQQGKSEHHALADARWNRETWAFLKKIESSGRL